MTLKKNSPSTRSHRPDALSEGRDLRQQAEEKLSQQKSAVTSTTDADTLRLLHELQVHQIELEMQNEELVQARAEVEEAYGQYTDLYDFAPVGYFTLARDGAIRKVNLAGANLLGMEREKLVNRRFGVFVSSEYLPTFNAFLEKLLSGHGRETCEVIFLKNDGEFFWARLEATCFEGSEESRAILVDITGHKQAEKDLRENASNLARSQQMGKLGSWEWNIAENTLSWSDEVYRIWGVGKDFPLTYDTIAGMIHPDDRGLNDRNVQEFLTTHDKGGFEFRIICPDGSVKYIHQSLEVVRTTGGQAVRMFGIMQDITERKQVEQALRDSEKALKESQVLGRTGNWEYDLATQELKWSDEIYALYERDKALGPPSVEEEARYYSPEEAARLHEFARLAGETGQDFEYDFMVRLPSGRISYFHGVMHPVKDQAGKIIKLVGVFQEITERKRAEELVHQYARDLEQRVGERTAELVRANRVKDEFLANMSHELRTPLSGILGFSETLLENVHGPLNEKQTRAVELIYSSGTHLLGLINDVLDVSKIESGKFEIQPEDILVDDVCQASLIFIKQLAQKKSINVEYSCSPSGLKVHADPRRLKQILVNLLNNAVKFTPERGQVKLEVWQDDRSSQLWFSVTDTGIGITPENQQKLFKPFVQLDSSLSRQYEGTGLGLSLVKKLVELHGGSVEVESKPGSGSCFRFNIPGDISQITGVESVKPSTQNTFNTPAASPVPGKRRIFLVEDNEISMMVTSDYLNKRGYEVVEVRDGINAIQQALQQKPDLILMDIQMPGMDGFETIKRLRAMTEFVSVPIIALTALVMPGDRERCLEAGANAYLAKPFSLKVLSEMVENLM